MQHLIEKKTDIHLTPNPTVRLLHLSTYINTYILQHCHPSNLTKSLPTTVKKWQKPSPLTTVFYQHQLNRMEHNINKERRT